MISCSNVHIECLLVSNADLPTIEASMPCNILAQEKPFCLNLAHMG